MKGTYKYGRSPGWNYLVEDSVVGQHSFHADPDTGIRWTKILKIPKKFILFLNCNIFIPRPQQRMPKLQEKRPALKGERPALKTKQFYSLYFYTSRFCPPGSRSGSTFLIMPKSGSSQPKSMQIHADSYLYPQHRFITWKAVKKYDVWDYGGEKG